MPRVVSFIVLVAILLLIGSMFFKVMLQFVVPLFLASVLVVVFKPLHEWIMKRLDGKPRLAALATTATIMLAVLAPMAWLGVNSYWEFSRELSFLIPHDGETAKAAAQRASLFDTIEERMGSASSLYEKYAREPLDIKGLLGQSTSWGVGTLKSGVQLALSLVIGLAIMILSLYYFLADGDAMIAALMRLSPLEDEYERELLDKFANVSRAVVVASLLSAVAQGLLAGIGYYFALKPSSPVFLLTAATMALAIVPFVGGAAVWVPTCLWVYFIDERAGAAIGLALYCAVIVSTVDNLIKPYVLHGQSNLHPLLALLSVLGGIQVLGPIGILVGPMLVAFIQALLNMLNKELLRMSSDDEEPQPAASGVSEAVAVQAEAAVASPANDLLSALESELPSAKQQETASKAKPKRKRKRKGS